MWRCYLYGTFSSGSLPALSFPCPSALSSCPLPMEVQDYNSQENNVTHVGVGVRRWSRAPENISSRSLVLIFQDLVFRRKIVKHLIHIHNINLQNFSFTQGNLQDCVHHGDSYGVSHSLALEGVLCLLNPIMYIFLL